MFIDVVVGKIWFALKGFVALVCFISGILVAVGVECGVDSSTLQIIIGGAVILASIFVMADFGGMKKALDRLHEENARFSENNERLEQSNTQYRGLNDQHEIQLAKQKSQLERREKQLNTSKVQLETLSGENVKLTEIVGNLESEIEDIAKQNAVHGKNNETQAAHIQKLEENVFSINLANGRLQEEIVNIKAEREALTKSVDGIKAERDRLRDQNTKYAEQNIKAGDNIKKMEGIIAKQKIIQDNANKLIQSLMSAGDDFKDFQKVIKESLDRIDNTADLLDVVATRMTDGKFDEIDVDGDGTVTEDEFTAWLKRQASD
jgi:chromosome segregation ATPase